MIVLIVAGVGSLPTQCLVSSLAGYSEAALTSDGCLR